MSLYVNFFLTKIFPLYQTQVSYIYIYIYIYIYKLGTRTIAYRAIWPRSPGHNENEFLKILNLYEEVEKSC